MLIGKVPSCRVLRSPPSEPYARNLFDILLN